MITGAISGIGRDIAKAMAAAGAMRTNINCEAWDDPGKAYETEGLIPYGSTGENDDIGYMVFRLASEASESLTESLEADRNWDYFPKITIRFQDECSAIFRRA